MPLRKLAKDLDSKNGGCPAVYVDEENPAVMVMQGKILDEDMAAELHEPLPDETAIRVPTETVVRAVKRYLAEQGNGDATADH